MSCSRSRKTSGGAGEDPEVLRLRLRMVRKNLRVRPGLGIKAYHLANHCGCLIPIPGLPQILQILLRKTIVRKVLVTGGSGFIGTNLIEACIGNGHEALNVDIEEPRDEKQRHVFRRVDIRDATALTDVFGEFCPTHVVHLAARTDIDEKAGLAGYDANTDGVRNMVDAVSRQSSVRRCIFTSTKLVCPTGQKVESDDDYCPDTVYGESKVVGEKIVKNCSTMQCDWCIVRPTSIWGPWCDIPYGMFFRMIGRGCYFHPGHVDPPRSFGYVGNVIFQMEKILDAPSDQVHKKTFYVSDYEPFTIRNWADTASWKMRQRKVKTIPEPIVRLLARVGDAMKCCGVKSPPLTSFRLRNMRADTTGVPLDRTRRLTGPLPFSMEQGVDEMVAWLGKQELAHLPRQ